MTHTYLDLYTSPSESQRVLIEGLCVTVESSLVVFVVLGEIFSEQLYSPFFETQVDRVEVVQKPGGGGK